MNKIQDKKRWWAANFCSTHTKCPENRFFGLGLGLGIAAALTVAMLAVAVLAAMVPEAHAHTPSVIFAGVLISDQLKMDRATKAEQAQAIYTAADTAKRSPTAEEKTKFDALMVEVSALTARIDDQIKIEAVLKDKPKAGVVPALDNNGLPNRPVVQFPLSSRKLKAFRTEHNGRKPEENAFRAGRWLQALATGGKDESAVRYCKDNGIVSFGTDQLMYNVHEEGTNSTGGVLVPDELEMAIIDLREQYGMFRRLARIVPMTSDYKVRPRRAGGLTAYPLAESAAFTESTKGWDNVSLTAKLWGVLAKYSWSLGEDAAISIADDLAKESAYAFAVAEDDCGFNGTGASAYHGIVGVLPKITTFVDSSGSGAVNPATATHNLFSEVDGDDIDLVVAALPQYADPDARLICSRVAKSLVFDPLLRAGGGNNKSDIAGRMLNTYLGYPIEIAQKMPAGASTDYQNLPMLLFGDLASAADLGVRRGITIQILNELFAGNGQLGLIASERFDINVHDVGTSSAAGPIVALMGSSS